MNPQSINNTEQNTIQALWKVTKVVLDTLEFDQVSQKVCDSLLSELGYLNLGYRIIVLSLFNPQQQGIQRISLSQTQEAKAAVEASTIPFKDITIPITATDNFCVKSYIDQKPYITHDWKDILSPPLQPEDARRNQEAAGIRTSMIYPVIVKGKSVGIVIFSMIKSEQEVTSDERDLITGFTEIVGIAVQNAKLYSEIEETTKHLDAANKRLEELDKLKDDFVSLASHELRTPMTAIKSYVWLILNGKAGLIDPKTKDYLDRVYISTERLIHLVNEMLDVSRIESGRVQMKLTTFNPLDLAHDVESEFSARAAEQKITFSISAVCDNPPPLTADREKIHQVLENLIGNAFKFTPADGHVTLGLKCQDSQIEFSITDTGIGIAPEDQSRLFTKFGRLEGSLTVTPQAGTGLGLYLSKQYVEMHKGKVWFTSELGKGSTFFFTLPLSQ